jgi:hypothetical protein
MVANSTGRRSATARSAFTLIELAAVGAAAAVLITQALLGAAALRGKSRAVSCQDKLGQIARASLVYGAADAFEQVIPVGVGDVDSQYTRFSFYAFGGKSGVGVASDPAQSEFGTGNQMGPARRPLNAILFKTPFPDWYAQEVVEHYLDDARLDLDVYHCPDDRGFPGMHHRAWKDSGLSSYDFYGTSYAANAFWISDPLSPRYLMTNSMYWRPASFVPNPGNTIMYWENAARYALYSDNPEYGADQPPGECRRYFGAPYIAHGWHGQDWRFNAALGDGHVANIFVRSYRRTQLSELSPQCGPGSRCVCIVVRGDGWQRDTMPSPLIDSSHLSTSGGSPTSGDFDRGSAWDIVP